MSDQARDDDRQQMSLAVHFHPTGHHVAAWLHPRSQIDAGSNPAHYLEMAKTASVRDQSLLLGIAETFLKLAEETLPKLETPFESAELCGVACCPRHCFARVLVPS